MRSNEDPVHPKRIKLFLKGGGYKNVKILCRKEEAVLNDSIYAKRPKEANPLSQMQAGRLQSWGEGEDGK